MSMRTPFSIVTGLGSAKEGTTHFWRQRLTALANIPLTIFLVWLIVKLAGSDRVDMVALISNPIVSTLLVLTFVSVIWHMRLGMQVVIEDYVHGEGAKILALTANNFFCLGVGALAIISILKLGFGG